MSSLYSRKNGVNRMNLNKTARICYKIAKEKGWWESNRSRAETIALIHSEISECLEALRDGNPTSDIALLAREGITKGEEELADAMIRILDFCGREHWNIQRALMLKCEWNMKRSHKHGKEF